LPLVASDKNVNAWYLGPPEIYPVVIDENTISVAEGASVNFNQISFNPHAHGTHTETVGHITKKVHSINKHLTQFFFLAEVITVVPEVSGEDYIISKKQLQFALGNKKREAVVIRTLPKPEKIRKASSIPIPTGLILLRRRRFISDPKALNTGWLTFPVWIRKKTMANCYVTMPSGTLPKAFVWMPPSPK
jgi:hypothetical protein